MLSILSSHTGWRLLIKFDMHLREILDKVVKKKNILIMFAPAKTFFDLEMKKVFG